MGNNEKVRAIVLGCGEAFDEELSATSILVQAGATLLLDCGYSAPPRVWRAVQDPNAIDAIYLTHAHADHYFGMPALLGRMWEDGRIKPLTIVSQAVVLEQLRLLLELGYKGLPARYKFPIDYREIRSSSTVEVLGFSLSFAGTIHSASNLAIRIESQGHSICFSGDGMFTQSSRELCSKADLVIHEAYSFEPSPVHTDIPSLLAMYAEEEIGHLAMVHLQRRVRREQRGRIQEEIQARAGSCSLPEPGASYSCSNPDGS